MNHRIAAILLCGICLVNGGCPARDPVPLSDRRIRGAAASEHEVSVSAYRLPKGSFKGYYWEFDKDRAFRIWIIDESTNEDVYLYIPVPDEFLAFKEEVIYDDWRISSRQDPSAKTVTYTIVSETERVDVTIELPVENEKLYSIGVLQSPDRAYLIVFGNGSDLARHRGESGILGFTMVRPKGTR